MAAVAYTLVSATAKQLVYSWLGDSAGTLAYATMAADASVDGPLKSTLAALSGETDSNAKAISALISGESFVGAVTALVKTGIQSRVVLSTGAAVVPLLTAVDNGAGNSPDITIGVAAAGTGFLFIEIATR